MLSRIPTHYWALISLCVWGGAILFFGAVRFDAFTLDEGAAHALLLNWSISDQIVNPIATYGGPDFRALLFIPLGMYWPGSIIAAKVFTIMMMFAGSMGLYYWSRKHQGDEIALIATGLLLILPVTIQSIDQISVGPYLLLMFTLGAWFDTKYRNSPHTISSLFFIQCILVAITVTLHPMGLAYPAALAWHWYKTPKPGDNQSKQQKQVWTGIGIAVFIIIAMQTGWINLAWFSNPIESLDNALLGYNLLSKDDSSLWAGIMLITLLVVTLIRTIKSSLDTLAGSMLSFSLLLGLVCADQNWALLAITYILFMGAPLLIQLNKKIGMNNFLGQRGLLMIAIIILTTISMQANKSHTQLIAAEILSDRDLTIQTLAKAAQDTDQPFLAASEWPARTMIICKRDVLPLPPAYETGEALLSSIKGITHVMFNHHDPANSELAKNFAEIAGVIIKIRNNSAELPQKEAVKVIEKQIDKPISKDSDVPNIEIPGKQ